MVNTRTSKRKCPPANSNDAAVGSSAKRRHLEEDGSGAGLLAVDDGKSKSESDTPNIVMPPRDNLFNEACLSLE